MCIGINMLKGDERRTKMDTEKHQGNKGNKGYRGTRGNKGEQEERA